MLDTIWIASMEWLELAHDIGAENIIHYLGIFVMVHPKVPGSCVNLSFKGMVHSLLFSDKKNRKKMSEINDSRV